MEINQRYFCPNCNKKIYEMNRAFHEATCGSIQRINQSDENHGIIRNDEFDEKIPDFSKYPKVPSKFKAEKIESLKVKKDPNPESIVCPKCTHPLDLEQLESHMNECKYLACRFC